MTRPTAKLFPALFLALALAALLPAGPAVAGAWPRDKGAAFLSSTLRLSMPRDAIDLAGLTEMGAYGSVYLEYGLTPRLTLGLDAGTSEAGDGKLILFGRLPLPLGNETNRLAASLGIGLRDDRPVLRPGLSYGRGLTLWDRVGWVAADVAVYLGQDGAKDLTTDVTADLTLGLKATERLTAMLQVEMGLGGAEEDGFVRMAPSAVLQLRPGLSLQLGVAIGVTGDDRAGLVLGLWREF